jgi:hypothetical protein
MTVGLVALVTTGLPEWPDGVPGRPRLRAGQDAAKERPKGQYLGAGYCAQCHSNGPAGLYTDDYVLLTEHKTWLEKDKHSLAYKKLTEPRAARMGALLNIKDVAADVRCLNCHAANVPKDQREEETFRITDGVSCDACHGPSSGWILPHSLKKWRTTPMEEKEKAGMIDVRDPAKRARMCASCHVGSVDEGKVVTHDMYAAGHPPLPGFEVATFSEEMPRHWRYQKQKKPAIQELLKVDAAEHERTKLALIGSAVVLRESASLLAGLAAPSRQDPEKGWPELAQFNCSACHHDLKSPSQRQERGHAGTPGRPLPRVWPMALAALAAQHADGEKAGPDFTAGLSDRTKELTGALSRQPFGKAADVAGAAGGLAKWADKLVEQLGRCKYDQARALRLLNDLCATASKQALDCDSARQLAWTFRVVYGELDPKPDKDKQVNEVLARLDAELKLTLPAGTGKDILAELSDSLARSNGYQPESAKKAFAELTGLLSAK